MRLKIMYHEKKIYTNIIIYTLYSKDFLSIVKERFYFFQIVYGTYTNYLLKKYHF